MNQMNIQAKKLVLIKELLRINDVDLITKLELIIRNEKKKLHKKDLKPMSVNDFHKMIDEAKKDSDEGRVISHSELKKKVRSWK